MTATTFIVDPALDVSVRSVACRCMYLLLRFAIINLNIFINIFLKSFWKYYWQMGLFLLNSLMSLTVIPLACQLLNIFSVRATKRLLFIEAFLLVQFTYPTCRFITNIINAKYTDNLQIEKTDDSAGPSKTEERSECSGKVNWKWFLIIEIPSFQRIPPSQLEITNRDHFHSRSPTSFILTSRYYLILYQSFYSQKD